MAGHRKERVEHQVRAELASLLVRESKDPRLHAVTVSAVRMTPDLRQARVYFRVLAEPVDVEGTLAALERATPFLRGALGRALGLRVTPTLRFEYDTAPDTARRVDELLHGHPPSEDDDA
jgi:ribosome-binding factor A